MILIEYQKNTKSVKVTIVGKKSNKDPKKETNKANEEATHHEFQK